MLDPWEQLNFMMKNLRCQLKEYAVSQNLYREYQAKKFRDHQYWAPTEEFIPFLTLWLSFSNSLMINITGDTFQKYTFIGPIAVSWKHHVQGRCVFKKHLLNA